MTPLEKMAARRTNHQQLPEDLRHIGAHLRRARLSRGMKLQELANQVGCSVSMVSKIETDKALPSLTTLHRIVNVLGLNIGMLFDEVSEDRRVIFRASTRPVISAKSGVSLERLVPFGADHIMQGNIHIVEPGCGSEGSLQHEGEEVGFVLEGELDLTLDGRTYRLGPRDSFNFPSQLTHSYTNPGKIMTRVIWINTPPTF